MSNQRPLLHKHAYGICVLILFLHSLAWTMPLSLMSKSELDALPESILRANGRHRVTPGETTYGLAKKMGLNYNLFYRFNLYAYPNCGDPELLPAGTIVMIGNPLEIRKVTEAGAFAGRHSLHEYEFLAVRERSESGRNVRCCWSIAWPEKECGLFPTGLKKLQNIVISSCFVADAAYSRDQGSQIKMDTIEEAEKVFRNLAHQDFYHTDSWWEFSSICELSWPFGMKWEDEAWYKRPVIVLKNNGYSNNMGNGCHDFFRGFIVSIPDGAILTEHDYFREESLDGLAELVAKRFVQKYGDVMSWEEDNKVRTGKHCWLTLSEQGMTWWVAPYSLFCGAVGVANVTIPWDDLKPFAR